MAGNFIPFEDIEEMKLSEIKQYLDALDKRAENFKQLKQMSQYFETLYNIGTVNGILAEKTFDLPLKKQCCLNGIHALKEVLKTLDIRKKDPFYANLYVHIGNIYHILGEVEETSKNCKISRNYLNIALSIFEKYQLADNISDVNNNLGNNYVYLARITDCVSNCNQAITFFNKALKTRLKETTPLSYAETQNNLGNAYRILCNVDNFRENSENAIRAYSESLEVCLAQNKPELYHMTQLNYQQILELKKVKMFKRRYFTDSVSRIMLNTSYEIFPPPWEGGFGLVYLAFNHDSNAVLALKTYHDKYLEDSTIRGRFKKEAEIWVGLRNNPYIVKAHLLDKINDRLYIVMEYIPDNESGCRTLEDYINFQKINIELAVKWGIEICLGMEYACNQGIVYHGDLKPSNILITPIDQTAKIADFGLVNVNEILNARYESILEGVGVEVVSELLGTSMYVAPECFANIELRDIRSDIFSFGIVLYEIETQGGHPFIDLKENITSNEEYTHKLLFWAQQNRLEIPIIDSPLGPIIHKTLQHQPNDRFQTFEEIRLELEKLYLRLTGHSYIPITQLKDEYQDFLHKGVSFDFLKKYEMAIKCYQCAINLNPNETAAFINMAYSLGQLGRYPEAMDCCNNAIKIDSDSYMAYHNKGNIYIKMGLHDNATKCFDKALGIAPWKVEIIVDKALALNYAGEFKLSLKCCDDASDINSNHPSIFNIRGMNWCKLGKCDMGIKFYDLAIEIEPHYIHAIFNKGLAYVELEKWADARDCFNKVLGLDSRYPDALRCLNLCIKKGNL